MPAMSHAIRTAIAEDEEPRRWYGSLGFRAGETRTFEHLPFTVLYMSADLEDMA